MPRIRKGNAMGLLLLAGIICIPVSFMVGADQGFEEGAKVFAISIVCLGLWIMYAKGIF